MSDRADLCRDFAWRERKVLSGQHWLGALFALGAVRSRTRVDHGAHGLAARAALL